MTQNEMSHRDFYLALRRERGGLALRVCNRMPDRRTAKLRAPTAAAAASTPLVHAPVN